MKAAYLAIVVLFATVFCWSLAAQDGATGLTAQAQQALARAEADVREAGSKKSLWTTALDALKLARDAAAKSDSAAVIEHARTASEEALLGVEQTHYPLVK